MHAPLNIKTCNSLLKSMIQINDLIKVAKENNIQALTITDNNMYGVLDFYNACKKNNIKVDDINYKEDMGWPIDYIYESIKKYPENKQFFTEKEWNDIDHFFRCCTCNIDFPLYIDFSYQTPNAKLVSNEIRKLGGKVFLAHLFTYPLRNYEEYLDSLIQENIIDGIETYYSKFIDEQIEFVKNYCEKNNLYMSAGTDCHGDKKPDRKVGIGYGNMNVPTSIIKNWINL